MARGTAILALLLVSTILPAQDDAKKPPPRFGMNVDQFTFPQQTPKAAMNSIAKAIERKKIDYLLAHLADEAFVNYWVDRYAREFTKGNEQARRLLAFERLIAETERYYQSDPLIVKELRIFADGRVAQDVKISKLTDDKTWPEDKEDLMHGRFLDVKDDAFRIETRTGTVRFLRGEAPKITDVEADKPVNWDAELKTYVGKLMTVTFQHGAKWAEKDGAAVGTIESIPARKVFMKKMGDRWFLENKQQ